VRRFLVSLRLGRCGDWRVDERHRRRKHGACDGGSGCARTEHQESATIGVRRADSNRWRPRRVAMDSISHGASAKQVPHA